MRRLITLAAAVAMSIVAFAPAASAAGQLCYDVNVQVQDQAVVQADCVDF